MLPSSTVENYLKALYQAEATLGEPENDNFLAEHMKIAFGKPGGVVLPGGDVMTYFWCTTQGVTHTRWARLNVN